MIRSVGSRIEIEVSTRIFWGPFPNFVSSIAKVAVLVVVVVVVVVAAAAAAAAAAI